jgi:hypothetical protein
MREHLAMLANGFVRSGELQEVRAEAETRIQAAEDSVIMAQTDPVAFLQRANPATRSMVVRNLLLDPAVVAATRDDLDQLLTHGVQAIEDRSVRDRLEYKEQASQDAEAYRGRQRFVAQLDRVLTDAVGAIDRTPAEKDAIFDLFLDHLEAHETRAGKKFTRVSDALHTLAPIARVHNVDFTDRPAAAVSPVAPARPAPPAPAKPAPRAPAPSLATLQANARIKTGTAAVASTGRTAPDVPTTAPVRAVAGASIRDATKALRAAVRRTT